MSDARLQNSSDSAVNGPDPAVSGPAHADSEEFGRPGWAVVIPVKPAARGKSRLAIPGVDRQALARAIALDTIAAVAACEVVRQVVVVGDDGGLALEAAGIRGLRFVPEPSPGGLNPAIAAGVAAVDERTPRAALLGDLPALRPADLAAALREARGLARAVVADADGTGTTLLTAAPAIPWTSAFGEGSFAKHLALGAAALSVTDASTLRHDVDTVAQLDAARALGLGPRTAALLAAHPA
ncbi:2-phospho-L-lactate guanylyltransferase [Microbacterium sp. BWT-B31]|uniref:2-phospho-L-lactate guanylyltransferase n=1 Tax=Microbacterium sp. BWT-B31 TaxID=3232072 RepID=UPI0035296241